ncbi:MAG: molybdate ABC transporter substrate-binding protein [Campylobacterales bacterium]|nr:molybdate ABC transporter substrate-binding protein [Campylobacterales bacterium]
MKKLFLALFFLLNVVYAENIKVAVAANMATAIEEIKEEFLKENRDDSIEFIIGSSGKLAAQIAQNAPYSLFLSADMDTPQKLYEQKLALSEPKVYAKGALAMFTIKDIDLAKGIKVLEDKNIEKIAIANPKTAPYGKASLEAFKNAKIDVEKKLVYGESITQTLQFATTASDMAIVALSSMKDEKMKKYIEGKNWVKVDNSLYNPINQGVVITKIGEKSDLTKRFYEFLFSQKAKEIFVKYGYVLE